MHKNRQNRNDCKVQLHVTLCDFGNVYDKAASSYHPKDEFNRNTAPVPNVQHSLRGHGYGEGVRDDAMSCLKCILPAVMNAR